jgi:uroporphyrinogen-III synthase
MSSEERNLWITRPSMDGERMATLAREHGLVPWIMPVLDIFWMRPTREGLRAFNNAEIVLVTSRHALTSLDKAHIALPQSVQWFAIGQATADALSERGISAIVPEQTDSEGLLILLSEHLADGQQLVILKGEGGRTLLTTKLRDRGMLVMEIPLYRRICKSVESGMIDTFLRQEQRVLSVASGETLTCLLKAATLTQARALIHLPLVVMSERVATFAREKGWRGTLFVAPEMSSLGLIEAAKQVVF